LKEFDDDQAKKRDNSQVRTQGRVSVAVEHNNSVEMVKWHNDMKNMGKKNKAI
jgi:hypothetical protein